jgi:hypothetical protein
MSPVECRSESQAQELFLWAKFKPCPEKKQSINKAHEKETANQ